MSGLPGPAWPGAARPIPKEPAVLEDAVVRKVLGAALATGGEWAEVYAEDRLSHNIRLEDRRVEELVTGRDRGAGVRVVRGTSSAYAYTNRLDAESLAEAARVASAALRDQPRIEARDLRRRTPGVVHPVRIDPAGIDRTTLAELVRRADDAARAYDRTVTQVSAAYGDARQRVFIANSDGFTTSEERVRTRLVVSVVASRNGDVQTGFDGPAPAGEMPVVVASGNGGVLFHESSGHGMEADLVAKHASVYDGKRGRKIGVDGFNGIDDATVEGGWGSFAFDDEGTPAQRTVLFADGVCGDYLTDLIRARQLGAHASGNDRRESYAQVPIPRMTNTYIEAGG